MNALADFILTATIIMGPPLLLLALFGGIAEFALKHKYEIKWCWRVSRWLEARWLK